MGNHRGLHTPTQHNTRTNRTETLICCALWCGDIRTSFLSSSEVMICWMDVQWLKGRGPPKISMTMQPNAQMSTFSVIRLAEGCSQPHQATPSIANAPVPLSVSVAVSVCLSVCVSVCVCTG